MLMVSVNAYSPISAWLLEMHDINLSFPLFMVFIILPVVLAYTLAWKYLVKSFYSSTVEQFWEQSRKLVVKMLEEELPGIVEKLEKK